MRRIKLGLTSFVVITAVSIIYVSLWLVMAFQFRGSINEWVDARRAAGYQVNYTKHQLSGFPLTLRMDLAEPSLAPPDSAWSWQGESAIIEASPWNPWQATLRLSGAHNLQIMSKSGPLTYSGTAAQLTAQIPLSADWPRQGNVTIRDFMLSAGGDDKAGVHRAVIGIKRLNEADTKHNKPSLSFHIEVDKAIVSNRFPMPLGNKVAKFTMQGNILGFIPPGPLAQSLAKWRDTGGTIELTNLSTTYGHLIAKAGGTIALDAMAQPIGAFSAKVQGFFETVEQLRKQGLISGKAAVTSTVMLSAMSRKSKNGGAPTLNLALTIQDRKIYAGPVALFDMPAITWGENNGGENNGGEKQ